MISLSRTVALIFYSALLSAQACMPPKEQHESDVAAAFPIPDELIPIPRAKSPAEIADFGEAILTQSRTARSAISGLNPGRNLRFVLMRQIREMGGVPRPQIKEILSKLLSHDQSACGGVSCTRVFGIEKDDIDEFLDDTYRELATDQTLAKKENLSLRKLYLGSLKRGPNDTVPPVKSLPVQVIYKLAKFVGKSGVTVSDPNFHFMIDFYPGDLNRAHKVGCSDKECEARILKPVSININSPVVLNTQVIVRYSIGLEHSSGRVQHDAIIGGRLIPVSVGSILSISMDLWAEVERSARTEYKSVIKTFQCAGSIYCNTPWFSAGATIGREGIQFDSYITAAASLGSFAKVTPALPSHTTDIKYKDLPQKIRQIKEAVDSGSLGEPPTLDPDILWAAFIGARTQ
jgi:hypothetical protein